MYRSPSARLGWLLGFAIGMWLCGCAKPVATMPDVEPVSELIYADSDEFDLVLSRSLDSAIPQVRLVIEEPVSTEALPQRLDRWLYAVSEKYGGNLVLRPEAGTASGHSAVLGDVGLAIRDHRGLSGFVVYHPARGYDATVYYQPATSHVTAVVFHRRAP